MTVPIESCQHTSVLFYISLDLLFCDTDSISIIGILAVNLWDTTQVTCESKVNCLIRPVFKIIGEHYLYGPKISILKYLLSD